MTKEQLTKKAEALGIEVDSRWGAERIQQEIDKKEAADAAASAAARIANTGPNGPTGTDNVAAPQPTIKFAPDLTSEPPKIVDQTPGETPRPITETVEPKAKEKKVKVVLNAAYWPEEGTRVEAGDSIEIPASKAKELVTAGKAQYPHPGDE